MPQRVITWQRRDATAVIVDAIRKYGARNLSIISRVTKIPVETVRYKVKKQLPEMGFTIYLSLAANRLGVTRHIVEFKLDESRVPARELFDALARSSFLTYFGRKLNEDGFVTKFWVPNSLRDKFQAFLELLVKIRAVESFRTEPVNWIRQTSFEPEFYDFRTRRWVVAWESVKRMVETAVEPIYGTEERPEVDKLDLLVLGAMQGNALASLNSIARNLRVHPKTLRYHFKNHASRLIQGYYMRWGNRNRENFVVLLYTFGGLREEEFKKVRRVFCNHPFQWLEEGRNKNFYAAWILAPVNEFVESIGYVRDKLGGLMEKANMVIIDTRTEQAYRFPYDFFDEKKGWTFDPEKTVRLLAKIIRRLPLETRWKKKIAS